MESTNFEFLGYGNYSQASDSEAFPLETVQDDNSLVAQAGDDDVSHENAVTTTFTVDGAAMSHSYSHIGTTDNYTIRDQTISDFLAKPYLVQQFQWTTGNNANTIIGTSTSVASLLSTNTYWANKIQGYAMVRGTVVWKVVINSNPFQNGMILVHFLPNAADHAAIDPGYVAMHNANLTTKFQQPHVVINCRDSSGTMIVPYVAPTSFYPIKAAQFDWGTFYMSVLAPLRTGSAGETTVDVAVYAWFEDFELAAPLVPQAGKSKKKYSTKAIMDREKDALDVAPISSGLRSVSAAASALSNIPLLAPFATPVAWATDVAAGVASFLGFSKPNNTLVPMEISRQYNRYAASSDGVDISYPLALRSDNEVTVLKDLTIREEDEMSFAFLKRVEAVWQPTAGQITWANNVTSGNSLASFTISPSTLFVSGTRTLGGTTVTYYTGPPIWYLSNWFYFWRGSVKLRFKIAKTDFHTGRLQVTWTPSNNVDTAMTLTNANLALREIIDLKCGNEFEITLPYLLPYEYLPCTSYSGQVDIIILNELRCPETASGTIDIIMTVCGGDDFELQAPNWDNWVTINGGTAYTRLPFSPQADNNDLADDCPPLVEHVVAGQSTPEVSTIHSQYCIGEHFMSIKQLLKRTSQLYSGGMPITNLDNSFTMWPWFSYTSYLSSGGVYEASTGPGDIFALLAPLYAGFRGGVNIMVDFPAGNANPVHASLSVGQIGTNAPWAPGPANLTAGGALTILTSSTQGLSGMAVAESIGIVSYNIPYMSQTRWTMNAPLQQGANASADPSQPQILLNVLSNSNIEYYNVFRSFRDDFQLGYFIGCPPLAIHH